MGQREPLQGVFSPLVWQPVSKPDHNPHSLMSRFASTYWAIPAATFLDSFMASTTVAGPCTTSPLLNTPARLLTLRPLSFHF